MSQALKRALVGYSLPQTKQLLAQLEVERKNNANARDAYLEAVREALHATRQRLGELEKAVAYEREEQSALLATVDVLAGQGQDRIRTFKNQLAAREQEKLSEIASQEAVLGEHRAKLRNLRMNILQMAALVEDDLEWPEESFVPPPVRAEQSGEASPRRKTTSDLL